MWVYDIWVPYLFMNIYPASNNNKLSYKFFSLQIHYTLSQFEGILTFIQIEHHSVGSYSGMHIQACIYKGVLMDNVIGPLLTVLLMCQENRGRLMGPNNSSSIMFSWHSIRCSDWRTVKRGPITFSRADWIRNEKPTTNWARPSYNSTRWAYSLGLTVLQFTRWA